MAVAPLQIPGYATPQSLDFSPLAQLGQVYNQSRDAAVEKQTLASLGRGPDGKIDTAPLINSGNLKLSQLGIQIDQRQQDQDRQARQDTRQTGRDAVDDKFRAESLALQRRAAARADEDKPIIKEGTDANGNTVFYRINPRTGESSALSPTGAPPASGGNPFGGGKFNEGQGKAAGFTDRMLQSEALLSGKAPETGIGPVTPGADIEGTSLTARGISKVPLVGNYAVGEDYQKYNQAKSDFINAQLRRESGAAIAPSEFESADKQYFPRPGDSPQVIEQKRANRRAAITAMGREGGPSYRPEATFREDGAIASTKPRIAPAQSPVEQPQQPQAAQPQPQAPAALSNGSTATNPKTGERIIFQDGKWVPFS